jgi:hypothetical protein
VTPFPHRHLSPELSDDPWLQLYHILNPFVKNIKNLIFHFGTSRTEKFLYPVPFNAPPLEA